MDRGACRLSEEDARDDLEHEAAEDDEGEDTYKYDKVNTFSPAQPAWPTASPFMPKIARMSACYLPSQKGEMGDLGASLVRFLISLSDLPRRASWSLVNLAFRRLCSSVCACFSLC